MERTIGAIYEPGKGCHFRVWAPAAKTVALKLLTPSPRLLQMTRRANGYYDAFVPEAAPGTRYVYRIDDKLDRPDPASSYQPEGVHGPSEVIDPQFEWNDQTWFGLPLKEYILYELHVGTFTQAGTFEAIISKLPWLKELGVTAIEVMPVAQFPGNRNWGYDGVGLFSTQNSYGGPAGLKKLVNECHRHGLAVVLDVVYNHLGPEGNYLSDFGPYFTSRYSTPWGKALNFDGADSDAVREFFLQNALYWQTEFHIDALRLDAVHAINDFSATPFLQELATLTKERADRLNRRFHLIAENDHNNARYTLPQSIGGYGLAAQWSDDFHHALHVLLTGEQKGYYEDFCGIQDLAKVFREGYVYTGQYSRHRRRKHGSRTHLNSSEQFVVCSQNHDQIGNRMRGDRLAESLSFDELRLGAAVVLLSPFVPLLFMGEEYGETAPFQYFISHSDPQLIEAVRKGRREEFSSFGWSEDVPDPQDERTFERCKLNHPLAETGPHRALRDFYKELIRLRKELPVLRAIARENIQTEIDPEGRALRVLYEAGNDHLCLVFNFAKSACSPTFILPRGRWRKVLDSSDPTWGGTDGSSPEEALSEGRLTLHLPARSALVFQATPN